MSKICRSAVVWEGIGCPWWSSVLSAKLDVKTDLPKLRNSGFGWLKSDLETGTNPQPYQPMHGESNISSDSTGLLQSSHCCVSSYKVLVENFVLPFEWMSRYCLPKRSTLVMTTNGSGPCQQTLCHHESCSKLTHRPNVRKSRPESDWC